MLRHRREQEKIKRNWREVRILAIVLTLISLAIVFRLWRDGLFYFSYETQKQEAIITKVVMVPVRVGYYIKYLQGLDYSYSYENQVFEGRTQEDKSIGLKKEGDVVTIEVLKRKPAISRIVME